MKTRVLSIIKAANKTLTSSKIRITGLVWTSLILVYRHLHLEYSNLKWTFLIQVKFELNLIWWAGTTWTTSTWDSSKEDRYQTTILIWKLVYLTILLRLISSSHHNHLLRFKGRVDQFNLNIMLPRRNLIGTD